MVNILVEIISSPIFSATFFAWFSAQLIKMALAAARNKTISLKYFLKSGGMPSSHSALVTALAASILILEGPSVPFYISLVVAMIVVRDAIGVRYAVGLHAKALNKLLLNKDRINEEDGHTPLEAIAGIILGFIAAIVAVNGYSFFLILQVLYLMLPAVAANTAPIIAKKLQPSFDAPVDGGAKLRNKPLLGKNKTWRGVIAGIITFMVIVIIQKFLYAIPFFSKLSLLDYQSANILLMGLVVGAGVIIGDLVQSFIKRRLGIAPGEDFFPWDQIDGVIGGLVALLFFWIPAFEIVLVIVILAFTLSMIFNGIRHDMKW